MTKPEWTAIAAYLSLAVGKDFSTGQAAVYFDLLGDLDGDLVFAAAKAVLAKETYRLLPMPGAIRTAALSLRSDTLTAVEAWGLVMAAVRRFGLSKEQDALKSLPAAAARAAGGIGWRSLCDARLDDLDTIRAHFLKGFAAISEREAEKAALPASARVLIEGIGLDATAPKSDGRDGKSILKFIEHK